MSKQEVEKKIIEIAHEFAKRYGEDILQLRVDEFIAYITPLLSLDELDIFRHNQYEMIKLFVETVKKDLGKS